MTKKTPMHVYMHVPSMYHHSLNSWFCFQTHLFYPLLYSFMWWLSYQQPVWECDHTFLSSCQQRWRRWHTTMCICKYSPAVSLFMAQKVFLRCWLPCTIHTLHVNVCTIWVAYMSKDKSWLIFIMLCLSFRPMYMVENGSFWSTNGCRRIVLENGSVLCSCNHLTHFAILLSPGAKVREEEVECISGYITKPWVISTHRLIQCTLKYWPSSDKCLYLCH